MARKSFDYSRSVAPINPLRLITPSELARDLKVSRSTVRRMIKEGRLPEPLRTNKGYNGGWLAGTLSDWAKTQIHGKK